MSNQPSDLCKSHDSRISRLEERFQIEREHAAEVKSLQGNFNEERDRRYREVDEERAKALKIKENADKTAMELAREIQTYKDEKANELREQIGSERGLYAEKEAVDSRVTAVIRELETKIKPLSDFVSARQGQREGFKMTGGFLVGLASVIGVLLLMGSLLVSAAIFVSRATVAPLPTSAPAKVEVTNSESNKVPVKQ